MEDSKKPSEVGPRKMKFKPKIPPKKDPKVAKTKQGPPDADESNAIDSKLMSMIKLSETGKDTPKFQRNKAPVQVAFGHTVEETPFGHMVKTTATKLSVRKDQDGDAPIEGGNVPIGNQDASIAGFSAPIANGSELKAGKDVQIKEKKFEEPWNYDTYYPTTLPFRPPLSGNPEALDEEEFGKASKKYDETCVNAAKELQLMEDGRGQMLLIQFPSCLPSAKRSATASKDKEVAGKKVDIPARYCRLEDLPAGFMGKLLVYKSGRVKIKLGDVLFDVSPGADVSFPEDVMAVNVDKKGCGILGPVARRAVVTPDLGPILGSEADME